MLQHWIDTWDERIEAWVSAGGPHDARGPLVDGCEVIRRAYRGDGPRELDGSALPEPYVGDPLGDELWAAIITLNPGRTQASHQRLPGGKYVQRIAAGARYSQIFRTWDGVLPATCRWWTRTSCFASRALNGKTDGDHTKICGLDLVPFHSEKWGVLDASVAGVPGWLEENVFAPVRAISERTALTRQARRRDSAALPVALAIGKEARLQLEALGFRCRFALTSDWARSDVVRWPEASPGKPHSRQLRWLESEDFGLAVLHTQLSSMHPPGEVFAELLRRIACDRDFRLQLAREDARLRGPMTSRDRP